MDCESLGVVTASIDRLHLHFLASKMWLVASVVWVKVVGA